MTTNEIKKIKELLGSPKKVVIVTHWSPDGDAMGSSLGLYNFLLKKKHKVQVITPNDYPSFLSWLPGNKHVINFLEKSKESKKYIQNADLIFCLDFNSLKRIEQMGILIKSSGAKKFIIDHHVQPDDFADFIHHDVKASSTAELVYEFINFLGDKKYIDKNIATCLYTGILTDTGSFRFPSTGANTHRIVAELIDCGAVNYKIYENVYDDNTQDRVKLLGYCLSEKLKFLPEYNTAFISLSEDELKQFNYKKGDTEGVVNYALSVEGIKFSAFFVQRDGIIKTSFRSKGKFDVNAFARAHFEGGGHVNAAGGCSFITLDETINKFVTILPQYKKVLQSNK